MKTRTFVARPTAIMPVGVERRQIISRYLHMRALTASY